MRGDKRVLVASRLKTHAWCKEGVPQLASLDHEVRSGGFVVGTVQAGSRHQLQGQQKWLCSFWSRYTGARSLALLCEDGIDHLSKSKRGRLVPVLSVQVGASTKYRMDTNEYPWQERQVERPVRVHGALCTRSHISWQKGRQGPLDGCHKVMTAME